MNSDDGLTMRPKGRGGQTLSGGARAEPARPACRAFVRSGAGAKWMMEMPYGGAGSNSASGKIAADAAARPHSTQWYFPDAGAGASGSALSDGAAMPLPKQMIDQAL